MVKKLMPVALLMPSMIKLCARKFSKSKDMIFVTGNKPSPQPRITPARRPNNNPWSKCLPFRNRKMINAGMKNIGSPAGSPVNFSPSEIFPE